MSDTEVDYLQQGFDPWSLTVPRLRSILVTHNVNYPSSAKKAQLVEIFNEQVVPQSKKILAQRARAKRSSKGIVDVESSQSQGNPFDDFDKIAPPASVRRSRSPRKASARIKSEDPDEAPIPTALASPRKRASRGASRQLETTDTDTGAEPDGSRSTRKPRRSAQTPDVKVEDTEEHFFRRTSDVFTHDNPFQSGSSPVPAVTPSDRRKTYSTEEDRPRSSKSSTSRRQTDGLATPYKESKVIPRQKTPEPMSLDAGEEFTPEEQLELLAEEAARGETAVVPRKQQQPKRSFNWSTPLSVLLITLLSVYAGWYRQEKIAVGYCGMGRPATTVIPPELEDKLPPWAITLAEPQCEPCPTHAYCMADFTVQCEQDYILKPHPLSLGGLVPLPPTCEPDGARVRRVQAVADKAVEELRERKAAFECGELKDESGTKVETPAIEEQELKEIVNQKRSKKLSNQDFDDLWAAALGEVKAREEVEVEIAKEDPRGQTDPGSFRNTYLSSTSLARVPLTCAVRRSIRLGLARYRIQIGSVIALILSALYGRARFRANRAAAAQVPALVDTVLQRLATQRELGDEDVDDPWLFLPNLRDDVLRHIHSLGQRESIWQRVKAVVEQNSNVRTSQREGRSGEVGRAWEWIGSGAGDSASKVRRRKSGRVSWGPDVKGEGTETPDADERSHLHQKWEEGGRPIY